MALAFKSSAVGSRDANPVNSVSISSTVNVAVGDLIYVSVSTSNSAYAAFNTVTDTAGNTFSEVSTWSVQQRSYWCVATQASSTDTITANFTAGSGYVYCDIVVCVFTKDSGDTISIETSTNKNAYGSSVDTTDCSSAGDDTVWVAGVYLGGTKTLSSVDIGGEATLVSSSTNRNHVMYRLPASTMTADATATISSAATYYAELIVFLSTASAGGVSIPVLQSSFRRRKI